MKKIELKLLEKRYSVCRLTSQSDLPKIYGDFYSITKTDDELSLVLEEGHEPKDSKIERGWKILKVFGPLDFSLTGIMYSLTKPLAEEKISIFAISTFDTDYLLVKNEKLDDAIRVLRKTGFVVICS